MVSNFLKFCSIMSQNASLEYRFGGYRLLAKDLRLSYRGRFLALTPKAAKTLLILLERAGTIVSKDELLRLVWSDGFVDESNLSQNVYALRRLFRATSGETLIENHPKRGYQFVASVTTNAAQPERRSALNAQALRAASIAAVALAALVLAAVPPPAEQTPSSRLSPPAAKEYALGWYYWRGSSEADLKLSVKHFRSVVARDPDNPVGYAGEAVANAKLAELWDGSPSGLISATNAERLAQRAVNLNQRSAVALAARGFVEFDIDGNVAAAREDLRRAIEVEPDLSVAHVWYGQVLLWQRDLAGARRELEEASSLDPSLPSIDYSLALDYYLSRDYRNAIVYAQFALGDQWSAQAARMLLAAAHQELHQYALAFQDAQAFSSTVDDALVASSIKAQLYASMGRWSEARRALDGVALLARQDAGHPLLVALAFAANKRDREAFAWLWRMGRIDRPLFALDPRLDALRQDRRFRRWLSS